MASACQLHIGQLDKKKRGVGFEPTTLCSLNRVLYPLSYQDTSAGSGSNLLSCGTKGWRMDC